MFARLRDTKITAKFIIWFLVIALVPLAIATYISYHNAQNVLEEEVAKSLLAVADNKANQIAAYLREKEESAAALSYMSDMVVAVEEFNKAYSEGGIHSPPYDAVEEKFAPFLTYYQREAGYDDIFLVNSDGEVIFSLGGLKYDSLYEIALYKDSQLAQAFLKTKESAETEISDFEYDPRTRQADVYIASPVFKGADTIGYAILQMSNKGLIQFVQDYTGLGETGEIVIAAKINNEAVFITPIRFDPQAAFTRRVALGSREGLSVQKAVAGDEGLDISVDYRGKKTLTVRKYLPAFRWGILVKMDTDEVFLSAERLRNNLLAVSIKILFLAAAAAVLIARSVTSPIRELTKVSGTIAGGGLSARAKVESKDEIGELASSFNQMTDRLVEAKSNVELKKAEVEVQKKLLEKANKELDSFVYTASHDLRAPLRGISSFASFLEEDYKNKLDKKGIDYLTEIREGANRMNQLIEDLLALSRISRIKNPYEKVAINALIDSVIKRIEFDIKKNKVDLQIQKNMPPVTCDRIKINEVFLNLINNGIKFSSKNTTEKPRIEVGYLDKGECHMFFVKDNGIGIDPKYHEQVFGIFKRLHTASEYEGTGAGLSIVKRIIDDHGGNIWIESDAGKGATFYFTIPKSLKEKAA